MPGSSSPDSALPGCQAQLVGLSWRARVTGKALSLYIPLTTTGLEGGPRGESVGIRCEDWPGLSHVFTSGACCCLRDTWEPVGAGKGVGTHSIQRKDILSPS